MIFLEQAVKENTRPLKRIAIVGNYLPRRCGIATFTTHLVSALKLYDPNVQIDVIVMNEGEACSYPLEVKLVIDRSDFEAYAKAAEFLNSGNYDVVSVQHEYGIFGGEAGAFLLSMLREVNSPIVTTMHTILREPNDAQRSVTSELLQLSSTVVVMSEKGKGFLHDLYGVAAENVELIPHGIPDFAQATAGRDLKADLSIKGPMILTFGLLSPDKGIQYAIEAMPDILAQNPGGVYVVLGATHPTIKANVGEVYRESLIEKAKELGVLDSLRFIDQFVTEDELVDYVVAADIYITPYLNPHQITSGTPAYALGPV